MVTCAAPLSRAAVEQLDLEALGAQILDVLGLSQSFPKAACYLREYGVEIILIKGATPGLRVH